MSSDCLFCKIIRGEVSSYKIYEDEEIFAFFDIMPCSRGHTLIVPKEHSATFSDMRSQDAANLFKVVNKITKHLKTNLSADGFSIGINNGKAAGQTVMHTHVHIIPRMKNDDGGSLHDIIQSDVDTSEDSMKELVELIKMTD